MVTVIGFVGLLVAGLGALAGGLIYVAVRVSRGGSVSARSERSEPAVANGRWLGEREE
jgi:hypothetical protein